MQAEDVKKLIEAGVDSAQVQVQGDGDHFEATIISSTFEGKSMVQQHQMVYASLGNALEGAVHAIALRTFTPEQWARQLPTG